MIKRKVVIVYMFLSNEFQETLIIMALIYFLNRIDCFPDSYSSNLILYMKFRIRLASECIFKNDNYYFINLRISYHKITEISTFCCSLTANALNIDSIGSHLFCNVFFVFKVLSSKFWLT